MPPKLHSIESEDADMTSESPLSDRVVRSLLPLSPKVFHILLALAEDSLNGYQLGLRIEESTDGAVRLSPGTLYENLARLESRGWIRDRADTPESDGRRQRFWSLTPTGWALLKAEVERLRGDLRVAANIPALGERADV